MENIQTINDTNIKCSVKEEKKWCVYIHRNKTNNKVYIGQTSEENPYNRWGTSGHGYVKLNKNGEFAQPIIASAILKYPDWDEGWDHIIFEDNLTQDEANKIESLLIALYKSNCCKYQNPSYGYNTNDGGSNLSGENNPNYGNHKVAGKNNPNYGNTGIRNVLSVIVYCIEFKEIFYGAREAERLYGIDHSCLIKVCNGKRKYAGKHPETGEPLHWLYVEEAIEQGYITQEELDDYLNGLREKEKETK